MTDTEQPKPCPSCGGESGITDCATHLGLTFYVHCVDCKLYGPWATTIAEAVRLWNTMLRPADLTKLAGYIDSLENCGMDEPMLILAIRTAIKDLAEKHTTEVDDGGS